MREVEGRVEEALKNKDTAEERVETTIKEKDEAESMARMTQATIQKFYKTIPDVPLVVKATMEEQVHTISEVIKGF